jgi:hypothetical protein
MRAHVYEVRPRKDHRGVDLISDALPFGGLWYAGRNAISNAIGYAKFRSRSHDAVIRVYDEAGNVIETHEYAGEVKIGKFFIAPTPMWRNGRRNGLKNAKLSISNHRFSFQKAIIFTREKQVFGKKSMCSP